MLKQESEHEEAFRNVVGHTATAWAVAVRFVAAGAPRAILTPNNVWIGGCRTLSAGLSCRTPLHYPFEGGDAGTQQKYVWNQDAFALAKLKTEEGCAAACLSPKMPFDCTAYYFQGSPQDGKHCSFTKATKIGIKFTGGKNLHVCAILKVTTTSKCGTARHVPLCMWY